MRFAALVVVAAAALLVVPGASASQPTREPSPFSDDSFSGICAFTVARHILVNKTYVTTFSDGRFMYTGAFKERLTNKTSGKSFDFNGSGPIIIVPTATGWTETDYGPQFERPPGQLLLTNGPVAWEYDADFNFLSYNQIAGTAQDVCALLS